DGFGHRWRQRFGCLTMPPPRVFGVAIGRREAGAHEVLAARQTVLLEEVRAQTVDEPAQRRLPGPAGEIAVVARAQAPDVAGQHRELRMADGTVIEEEVDAGPDAGEQAAQPFGRVATGNGSREVARSVLQISAQRLRRHEPSTEQRRDATPHTP